MSLQEASGLGFRNLECFNLALLSKQAWRLVTTPSSLLAQVLKARYFPREFFFTAELGDRPSMTWRSIVGARGALQQGLSRIIGNGATTAFWGDRWLPHGRIITRRPPHSNFPNLVADLIDWDAGGWEFDLISNVFWPVDVHNILQVPIGAPEIEDRLVWIYSKLGVFTFRL